MSSRGVELYRRTIFEAKSTERRQFKNDVQTRPPLLARAINYYLSSDVINASIATWLQQ